MTPSREVTPSRLMPKRRVHPVRFAEAIVAGGHGAFVAAFRNRVEIVLAHVNRDGVTSRDGVM